MRYISIFLGSIILVIGVYVAGVYMNLYGELEEPGVSVNSELPKSLLQNKLIAQKPFGKTKQILFGDTHVHTTYSTDAFFWSLPIMKSLWLKIVPVSLTLMRSSMEFPSNGYEPMMAMRVGALIQYPMVVLL